MTDRHDTATRPATDDEAIEQATDRVVETWSDATPGKDPNVEAEDFERMREGIGGLATDNEG